MQGIQIPEQYLEDWGTDEVLCRLRDYNCLDPLSGLPVSQQERIFGIAYNNVHNPYQRGLLQAGYNTIQDSGLLDENNGCIYLGIRGSVTRGEADNQEDVDIFALSNDISKTKEMLAEPSREEGMKLKESLPDIERVGERIVNYVVYDGGHFSNFFENPVLVDRIEPDIGHTQSQYNRIERFHNYVLARIGKILRNPNSDPIEFFKEMIQAGSFNKNRLYLKPKICGHNLIATAARTHGIHMIGEVPSHNITEIRDIFIKGLLEDTDSS